MINIVGVQYDDLLQPVRCLGPFPSLLLLLRFYFVASLLNVLVILTMVLAVNMVSETSCVMQCMLDNGCTVQGRA